MPEETTGEERATWVALHCSGCGARMRARQGREGLKCPHCHSADLRPVPVLGDAIDYAAADRRHGTAAADVMLAEWARWCDYITPNQYNAAMHRQNSELQTGGAARPIHEVMISLGLLGEERVSGLLRFLSRKRPDADDRDFLARLAGRGDLERSRLEDVAALQGKMARERREVPPIGQLLVQKRVITEARLLDVLREQAAEGLGSLHTALLMSRPPPKETAAGRLVRRAAGSPKLMRSIAVVVVLGLLATGLWALQLREKPLYVYGRCQRCEGIAKVEWSATDWPAKCPRCGSRAVYYAVRCPNGHIFTRKFPFTYETCPECGADRGYPLTDEDYARQGHQ